MTLVLFIAASYEIEVGLTSELGDVIQGRRIEKASQLAEDAPYFRMAIGSACGSWISLWKSPTQSGNLHPRRTLKPGMRSRGVIRRWIRWWRWRVSNPRPAAYEFHPDSTNARKTAITKGLARTGVGQEWATCPQFRNLSATRLTTYITGPA